MKPNFVGLKSAYDYRAFGEQVDLTRSMDKVTETFTGKEKDDETELSYFGARYLDQMLGMWVSVDAKRQFNSPFLYAGNGTNPVNGVDEDGNVFQLPPALVIGTAFVVKHLVTRVLPRYATKAIDVGMKITNPANVGKAAKVGAIGEIASRVNPSVEKAFDDLVFGASNGISNEVSSTLDMSKTITETLFDNLDGIVNSISDGMNSKLEKMQNTPVEDLVD
jgi:RHS repeat-associated protein